MELMVPSLFSGELYRTGTPVMVGWIDWGGHWTVVTGYDGRGTSNIADDVIIFADSADRHDDKPDGVTYFNARRFESMWFCVFPDHALDNQRVWIIPIPQSVEKLETEMSIDDHLIERILKVISRLFPVNMFLY